MGFHIFAFLELVLVFLFVTALLVGCHAAPNTDRKLYVVYMGDLPQFGVSTLSDLHSSMLQQVVSSGESRSITYSYKRSFNGFAAMLTEEEKQKLTDMEGVVSVFPSKKYQLHTTRSWDFMGFPLQVKRSPVESDTIVGMLDTGIWPESASFSDEGFGPPPKKWKGQCQKSSHFSCNNKIIGARYYRNNGTLGVGDVTSPRDTQGHGTHTASTAAGNMVSQASLAGLRSGTARGGVPSARIAVYKVCWSDGCYDADVLAAFDDAIADGVDIISISVGPKSPRSYFKDAIAIGSFHAMKNGILTSASAGNSGPQPATITNFAPWSLSVAASTIDRRFRTMIKLGNGEVYKGISINTFALEPKMYPLIYGGDAPNTRQGFNRTISRLCASNSLNKTLVKGKIVLCDSTKAEFVLTAGAVGTILRVKLRKDVAFSFPLPASVLGLRNGRNVLGYLNKTRQPTATIFKSTELKDRKAPYVASFSSRGPNPMTSDILKPDLTAPGVDILAAWSQATTLTGFPADKRVVPYNIISGTSMACPHASGVAAYVKSVHPRWSPAAIKSALMTTATPMSVAKNQDIEFAYGSGHVNPLRARNPGLVYDAGEADYVQFLCGQGLNENQLRSITGENYSCSKENKTAVWDLNYPSFTLSARTGQSVTRAFHRTVTNVGSGASIYKATVKAPESLQIQVTPQVLSFKSAGEKKSFVVTVNAKSNGISPISGTLIWEDGKHKVRTPIVAHTTSQ